jgi:hypothetical protein
MEEEFELLDSTFRKAGFQEELAACILYILFQHHLASGFPGVLLS